MFANTAERNQSSEDNPSGHDNLWGLASVLSQLRCLERWEALADWRWRSMFLDEWNRRDGNEVLLWEMLGFVVE